MPTIVALIICDRRSSSLTGRRSYLPSLLVRSHDAAGFLLAREPRRCSRGSPGPHAALVYHGGYWPGRCADARESGLSANRSALRCLMFCVRFDSPHASQWSGGVDVENAHLQGQLFAAYGWLQFSIGQRVGSGSCPPLHYAVRPRLHLHRCAPELR
jgi:hypothetical protein